jgi:hypothetical protein
MACSVSAASVDAFVLVQRVPTSTTTTGIDEPWGVYTSSADRQSTATETLVTADGAATDNNVYTGESESESDVWTITAATPRRALSLADELVSLFVDDACARVRAFWRRSGTTVAFTDACSGWVSGCRVCT